MASGEPERKYKILFSGLMVFVEYHKPNSEDDICDQVNVLLLNPGALPEAGAHEGTGGTHNDQDPFADLHEPQLMVKSADIADWRLDGVLQGCGWHHFDLAGRTVFPRLDKNGPVKLGNDRPVQLSTPDSDEFEVDPFGKMQHLSFPEGIVDMEKVLGEGKGRIDPTVLEAKPPDARREDIRNMIVAVVRLPAGELTALAPSANSTRTLLGWTIGEQNLDNLAEMAMFVPTDQDSRRIDLTLNRLDKQNEYEFVTWRRNPEVTVWITNEPRRRARTKGADLIKAEHFIHYYKLLKPGQEGQRGAVQSLPELQKAPRNIDNPLCPPCRMRSNNPLS